MNYKEHISDKRLGINPDSLANQQLISEIMHLINMERSPYKDWYIGITSNPHTQLFQEHNVDLNNSWWVIKKAGNAEEAGRIQRAIINTYGTDGGNDEGNEKSVYVYAYKKTRTTRQ